MLPLLHVGVGGPDWLDWSLHIDAILLCAALVGGYYVAVQELRPRIPDAGRVKPSQKLAFGLGVLALFVAAGTPVHDLGEEYLFSAHMVQHLLFQMAVAPLLIVGVPSWLWEGLLAGPRMRPVMRVLLHPLVGLASINLWMVIYHMPSVFNTAQHVGAFHFFTHILFVATAFQMWWPVLGSARGLPRLTYPLQMGYLFVQSLVPSVIAAIVTFADGAVYSFYAEAPRLWGISTITDQQVAGLLMKLLGSAVLWAFIIVAFFKWYNREQAAEQEPRWAEVERELEDIGLVPRG